MKLVSQIAILTLALAGTANAQFLGTDEEFLGIIESGEIPEVFPQDDLPKQNLRSLGKVGSRSVGDSCGENAPCKEGLDCVRVGIRRQCAPVSCVAQVIDDFIVDQKLEDLPQKVMTPTGFLGEDVMNPGMVKAGYSALTGQAENMLNNEFRDAITETMLANQPDMRLLLDNVLRSCPEAASEVGVTIMLGLNYEVGALARWYQNFYFAIGTGDIDLDLGAPNANSTSPLPSFGLNISAGVYSDLCSGAGIDAGFDLSITGGLFLSGTVADLTQCSFMVDLDAGVGSVTGLSGGLASGIPKFFFSQGMGCGFSLGISGCGTCNLTELEVNV